MQQITEQNGAHEVVTSDIFTIPNLISFARLCLIPVFFWLLLDGQDFAATMVFAVAAGTDWVDGQIARRTKCVSRLGQLLDPAVDRFLLISGVIGLFLVGRLALWIIIFVMVRDVGLLVLGGYLLRRYQIRVPVILLGKVATTFLYIGLAGLLLNWPLLPGLGICDFSWLMGFTSEACSWGIWMVYIGLILGIATTIVYLSVGKRAVDEVKAGTATETAPNAYELIDTGA